MSRNDYYGGYSSSRKPSNRKSGISLLFDAFFLVVSLIVAGLFIVLLIAPTIAPASIGAFAALGLYSLYLYVAMLTLTLYWLVRWRLINATCMGLLLIVGLFFISPYYKLEIRKQHSTKYPRSFKLLSYNLDQIDIEGHRRGYDSLREFIFREMPNIVTLQEAYKVDSLDSLLQLKRFTQMPYTAKRKDESMAIYSRYPFVKKHSVDSLDNIIWCDIVAEDDTIRIYNVSLHLDNAPIDSLTGQRVYREKNVSQRMTEWSSNSNVRANQLRAILPYINSSPYPYVVAGSLNDVPFTYVYNQLADSRQDAYVEKGYGYSYTYRGFYDNVRLDYAFLSPKIEVLSYQVLESANMAMHYPIFVRFSYESQKKIK